MALLWFTGFEGGHASKEPFYAATPGWADVTGAAARTGSYGCTLTSVNGGSGSGQFKAYNNLSGLVDQPFTNDTRVSFALKVYAGVPAGEEMFFYSYRPGTTIGLLLSLNSDGKVRVYEGDTSDDSTILLGTSSVAIDNGAFHLIQIKDDYVGGSPTHEVELIINGVQEVSTTTDNLGTSDVTVVHFGKYWQSFFSDTTYILYLDDVAISSDSFVEYPFYISMFLPNANGTYTAWGGGYTDMNEIPPDDDLSYISSGVSGHRETVSCQSCLGASAGKKITAIKMNFVAKRGGAGDELKLSLRDSGGTDNDTTTAILLPDTYDNPYTMLYDTNPDTSVAWTPFEVDATEIGVLNVGSVWTTRVTACQLHILYGGLSPEGLIAYNWGG